jgi:peptide/nickel transport system ATP-binding protein
MSGVAQPGVPAPRLEADAALRLSVQNLKICVGAVDGPDVVDDVSFDVRSGEVLGLVGESGSGKTTVALAMLGYARRGLTISSGRVCIDGTDLLTLKPSELQAMRGSTVSYVAQDPAAALNPAWRVGPQLREALSVHPGAVPDIDARVREILTDVALPANDETLGRYPHQFSGGQQQRVAIAMAFACRPSLIVLDEPTTGLDVSTQRHVLDTVRRLCAEYGVAAVYVTHDLAVVSGIVSQVAVMYAGRVVELGPMDRVFGSPVHPYTRGLLAAVPSPDQSEILHGIEGRPPRPGRRPTGCSFAPRCDLALPTCTEPDQPPVVDTGGRLVRCVRATEPILQIAPRANVLPSVETAGPAMITVSSVSASYQGNEVLHNVSLAVPTEACVAVVGESGSGKTTLARCIVGLHREFTGSVELAGSPLPSSYKERSVDSLRRVQYIFQNPYTSLNPRKTIGQILDQPLRHFFDFSRTERTDRVERVLRDVSLSEEFVNRHPDQLSGGERQRVAIARALIVEPDVLVCDEVTSALDVSVQAVIIELLRALQHERHLSMVFITHNLALVRSIAQSVAVLADGRVVESGPVQDVLDRPTQPYTVQLMSDVPRIVTTG